MKPEPATVTLHMTEAESLALQWLLKEEEKLWKLLLIGLTTATPARLPNALAMRGRAK